MLSYKELIEQNDALNAQLQKFHSQMAAQVQHVLRLSLVFVNCDLALEVRFFFFCSCIYKIHNAESRDLFSSAFLILLNL